MRKIRGRGDVQDWARKEICSEREGLTSKRADES